MKGGSKENNRAAALDGMNISLPEDVRAEPEEPERFGIFRENGEACEWFLRMQQRWVIAEMSGRHVRFDDQAIESQMKLRGVKKKHRAQLLDELMVMESAALEVLNKESGSGKW